MFSIQKFFGKDPHFFNLFEQSSNEANKASIVLLEFLSQPDSINLVQKLKTARARSKEITEEIQELVVKTFVTSLEREDIESLSIALYKILKPIEKFVERIQITQSLVSAKDFLAQAECLTEASERVCDLTKLIKKSNSLEETRRLNKSLSNLETNADELELALLKKLYSDKSIDAKQLYLIKDLHDLLEKAIDRCRDVGNIVMNIVLKNS